MYEQALRGQVLNQRNFLDDLWDSTIENPRDTQTGLIMPEQNNPTEINKDFFDFDASFYSDAPNFKEDKVFTDYSKTNTSFLNIGNDFSLQTPEMINPSTAAMTSAMGYSAIDSVLTNASNNKMLEDARVGLGPNGHAPDAMYHAQLSANTNSILSGVRSGIVTAGSMFGPEGTVAGAAIASGIHNFGDTQDYNTTQATSGDSINMSQIAT